MRRIIFLIFFTFQLQVIAAIKQPFGYADPSFYKEVVTFAQKFQRQISILEIVEDEVKYSFSLSRNCPNAAICIILLNGNGNLITKAIEGNGYRNITLCEPNLELGEILSTLPRCEHFDIVIIHDAVKKIFNNNSLESLRSVFNMGDNTFIEAKNKFWTQIFSDQLYRDRLQIVKSKNKINFAHYQCPRESLNIARWTQKQIDKNRSNYRITSNFKTKKFNKIGLESPIDWKSGINLVTFIMLRGLYPSDDSVTKQLQKIQERFPDHNDLVLGNFIVRGCKLDAIDFNDKRRKSNSKYCISKALAVFDRRKRRFYDPEQTIQNYYNEIKKENVKD